jgi:CheY-like chemotaxis protein
MTAEALEGYREACLEAGMDDYIPKPVTLRALTDAVRKWTAVPVEN